MPRRARLKVAGLPMHIVQRGNNRGPCFVADSDRLVYLALLEERAALFECAVHAYVLMSNHVHLLLTPSRPEGASRLMKHLGQEYVQYVNRSHSRTGSLWEGRFRSSPVDTEGYLIRCYRYIEMNPVRAGMTTRPGEYPWSSYRVNAWGRASTLVSPHSSYLALGATQSARLRAYERLFDEPLAQAHVEEIRAAVNGGFVLGSDDFAESLAESIGRTVSRRRLRNTTYCGRDRAKAE